MVSSFGAAASYSSTGDVLAAAAWLDRSRRALGDYLQILGYGPIEAPWQEAMRWPGARLRRYGEPKPTHASALIIPAPIKRAYIWDLEPRYSAVRALLGSGRCVYMMEWTDDLDGGFAEVGDLLGHSLDNVAARSGDAVVLLGHSLGGTFAAILAATRPHVIAALVLLEAPLRFGVEAGAFAPFTLAAPDMPASAIDQIGHIPGSMLDWFSVTADPLSFALMPAADALSIGADTELMASHMRVRRWTLDEFAIPARLFRDVILDLYRDDRFYRGTLRIAGRRIGPDGVTAPVLAVVNPLNPDVPPASSLHCLERMQASSRTVLKYRGERGVALQHVGILVGRRAHAITWPRILAWIQEQVRSHLRA